MTASVCIFNFYQSHSHHPNYPHSHNHAYSLLYLIHHPLQFILPRNHPNLILPNMRFTKAAAAALVALPTTLAQTYTDCNPMEKTCPKDVGLNSANFVSNFASDPNAEDSWSKAAYTTITYDNQGAQFRIASQGQAPTIATNFYFFFGRVDVTMKSASGQGIVSSIVLESDDLDEIDWEFLGGVDNAVQTNFFGKGDTSAYDRMIQYGVDSAQEVYHTYSLDWTAERIQWIIDGTVVRELKYTDSVALNGKVSILPTQLISQPTNNQQTYPQTPMKLKLGNWAGGADGQPEGTVTWAGGKTDFSKAPFDMYVQDVSITNYNPAASYEYSDKSGSWQSIKINKDDGSSSNGSSSSASPSSGSSTIATTSTSASSAPTSTTGANNSTSTEKSEEASSSSTSTTTEAYTSLASVEPLDQHTEAAVSVTQTGSMYSTNTASASALNSAISAATSTLSTSVSDSKPTGNSGGNSNWTGTSSAGAAEQTTNAGVKLGAAGSVVGLALGVMLL
jgi:beta-glucanase (GH16 family)